MAKKTELLILDDVYNFGFRDGLRERDNVKLISFINHISKLPQFEEYHLLLEYEDGYKEGKYTKTLNLLEED